LPSGNIHYNGCIPAPHLVMADFHALAQQLARVEHFRGLSQAELVRIISAGHIQRLPAGQLIFMEEDSSAGLYVLLSGRVQIFKLSPRGQISILALIEPVIMFNEVPAVDRKPNAVTAICLEDSLVWRLPSAELEALILQYPRVGWGLLQVMAQRNRSLVAKFQDLSFRSVLARAAKLLLVLAEKDGPAIDRRRHPNHQMEASVATVPEAFSRCLKVLRTFGDIQVNNRTIEILNPTHLYQIAQSEKPASDAPDQTSI